GHRIACRELEYVARDHGNTVAGFHADVAVIRAAVDLAHEGFARLVGGVDEGVVGTQHPRAPGAGDTGFDATPAGFAEVVEVAADAGAGGDEHDVVEVARAE